MLLIRSGPRQGRTSATTGSRSSQSSEQNDLPRLRFSIRDGHKTGRGAPAFVGGHVDGTGRGSGTVGHLHIHVLLRMSWTSGGGSAGGRDEDGAVGCASSSRSTGGGTGKHRRCCCREGTFEKWAAASVLDHRDTKDGATGAIPVALAVGEVGLVVDVGKGVALGAHTHAAFAAGADVIADK